MESQDNVGTGAEISTENDVPAIFLRRLRRLDLLQYGLCVEDIRGFSHLPYIFDIKKGHAGLPVAQEPD